MRRRLVAAALAGGTALSTAGCGELLFKNDHRVTITSPSQDSQVDTPLQLTWSTNDFVGGRDGSFAVFVDRDPQGPGQPVDRLSTGAGSVFTTTDTRLRINNIVAHSAADAFERNHHDATVILLDPSGHRLGETAGYVEFNVNGD